MSNLTREDAVLLQPFAVWTRRLKRSASILRGAANWQHLAFGNFQAKE
jgi:hypothetical protein